MRRVVICTLLVGVLAFAPAPLPRPSRGNEAVTEVNLRALKGTWRLTSFTWTGEGGHRSLSAGFTLVRVEGDDWVFAAGRDDPSPHTYRITLDPSKKPVALDFWTGRGVREESPIGKGIVRRRGDTLEVIYSFSGEARADRFDPPTPGHWLMKLERQR